MITKLLITRWCPLKKILGILTIAYQLWAHSKCWIFRGIHTWSNVHHGAWILVFPITNRSCSIKYCIIDICSLYCWHISRNNGNLWAIKCISKFNIAAPPNCLGVAKWSYEIRVTPIFSLLGHNMNTRGFNNVCNAFLVQRSNGKNIIIWVSWYIAPLWVANEMATIDTSNT